MARKAREKSELGIYMVYLKSTEGVSFDAEDKNNFLNILVQNKTFLLGYTLLNNSFLFVLREDYEPLESILRKVTIKFVKLFNKSHTHEGKVFTGRYASYPANTMEDVWQLIANVHSVANVNKDSISSNYDYFNDKYVKSGYPLNFFKTKAEFLDVCKSANSQSQKFKMTDEEIAQYIVNTFNIQPQNLVSMPKGFIEKVISQIFSVTKASVRQIARISTLPLRMLWGLAKSLKPNKQQTTQKVINEKQTNETRKITAKTASKTAKTCS